MQAFHCYLLLCTVMSCNWLGNLTFLVSLMVVHESVSAWSRQPKVCGALAV